MADLSRLLDQPLYPLPQLKTCPSLEEIKVILQKLENAGLRAYLAGGWLRDTLLGGTPKDVDIFIMYGGDTFSDEILDDVMIHYGNYEAMDMRDDVVGVSKSTTSELDIIYMKQDTIEEVVANFDVSICQIWGKLVGDSIQVFMTQDFADWKEKGVIYRYENVITCQSHLDRVRAKYKVDELVPKLSVLEDMVILTGETITSPID